MWSICLDDLFGYCRSVTICSGENLVASFSDDRRVTMGQMALIGFVLGVVCYISYDISEFIICLILTTYFYIISHGYCCNFFTLTKAIGYS